MIRAALSGRAINGPCVVMQRTRGATPVRCLAAIGGQLMARTDPRQTGPFRRAKNGSSQMRRPVHNIIMVMHIHVSAYVEINRKPIVLFILHGQDGERRMRANLIFMIFLKKTFQHLRFLSMQRRIDCAGLGQNSVGGVLLGKPRKVKFATNFCRFRAFPGLPLCGCMGEKNGTQLSSATTTTTKTTTKTTTTWLSRKSLTSQVFRMISDR